MYINIFILMCSKVYLNIMVKTIRVSKEEYELIIKARKELAKHGYQKLPINPEEEIDLSSFTIGAIAGLGALTLIYLLTENEDQ